tara:strand:+ start:33733 stop:34227 length:495 start_codon:yes stop_codon:yes gene_type:complete
MSNSDLIFPENSEDIQAQLKPADPKSHLTIIEQVYFQMPYEEPEGVETRFTKFVESEEEPYNKRKLVKDTKWETCPSEVSGSATVVIRHLGKRFQTNPTEEQKTEADNSILRVVLSPSPLLVDTMPSILVRPESSCRFEVEDTSFIYMKCLQGKARTRIYIFPS